MQQILGVSMGAIVLLVSAVFLYVTFWYEVPVPPTLSDAVKAAYNTGSTQSLVVAGGSFWAMEADLEQVPGVYEVISGYMGGDRPDPTYENYAIGGHREVVEVIFDSEVVSTEEVAIIALKHMDPTDALGSFYDRGTWYSPAFYVADEAEATLVRAVIAEIDEYGPYQAPLVVAVETRSELYVAEDYHQDYYKKLASANSYRHYRNASKRDEFISFHWGTSTDAMLPWRVSE